MKIGVVGTGRMGANIARRLYDVGYPVVALYDARPEAAAEVAAETGGEATASLARVAELAEVIVTVVTDDAAMREIFALQGDSLMADAAGRTFLNCATVSPAVHVAIERITRERGGDALEACMASSITQARRRHALLDDRRPPRGFRARETRCSKR